MSAERRSRRRSALASTSERAELHCAPRAAGGADHHRHLGDRLYRHRVATGRLRQHLRDAAAVGRPRSHPRDGGGAAPPLGPRPPRLRALLLLGEELRDGRLRSIPRPGGAGARRAAVTSRGHHAGDRGGVAVFLAGGVSHRALLGAAPVLGGRLLLDLRRVPGTVDSQLPAGPGADVRVVQVSGRRHRRAVLGRVPGGAVEPGQGARPAAAPVDSRGGGRHGGNREPDQDSPRQPARRAEEALRGGGTRPRPERDSGW